MSTPEYERFQAATIRRPDDVPPATPLSWHMERLTEHDHRLHARALREDFPYEVERGDLVDALAAIALRESMHRHIVVQRGSRIREAMEMGATWYEMAAALDIIPDETRTLLREWADGQHRLHRGDVERAADSPLGLTPERHVQVLALTELGDNETVRAATR